MAQSRSGKKSTKNSSGKKSTASSRGTGRSSTGRSASARSSAASRSRQPSRRAQRRAETPNLARSILLVGLGLLCVALVLVPGQNLWRTLRSWYFGVFGITTYLVGPFLLYLAYLLATGYRVALFAGKVSLMGVLCASVPVIFSKLNIENLKVGEIVKMLFTRGGTYFWEGGVLGAPIGATLLALFGRPASNIIMLLIFLLGLMFFFAITPADVVLFVDGQYKTLQAKREERAAAETAYDTRLFDQEPEEESVENLTGALPNSSRPHHPVGFGGDQALVVDGEQHHGFDKLRLHHRPAHGDNRLMRENRRTLRDRPYVAGKFKMAQIIEEFLAENLLGAQVFDVRLGKRKVPEVIDQLLNAGHDRQAAAVRDFPEEHIEIGDLVAPAVGEKPVGHRQLVKIGQQRQIIAAERRFLFPVHDKPILFHLQLSRRPGGPVHRICRHSSTPLSCMERQNTVFSRSAGWPGASKVSVSAVGTTTRPSWLRVLK